MTRRGARDATTYLFTLGELWVDELAVEDAGALGGGREEPEDEDDLHLVVERQPVVNTKRTMVVKRGWNTTSKHRRTVCTMIARKHEKGYRNCRVRYVDSENMIKTVNIGLLRL